MQIRFEWDAEKAAANERKHGLSFDEAQTVFYDERALLIVDPECCEGEERFLLLGLGAQARELVVCHCYRKDGSIIRIISARRATKNEQAQYWDQHQ